MATKISEKSDLHTLEGKYRLIYIVGRILQGLGLLLIWWVLLLFANTSDLTVILYSGFTIAIAVFYLGLACIKWAKKTYRSGRNLP